MQEPASLDSGRLRAAFQRVQAAQIAIRPQGNGVSARGPELTRTGRPSWPSTTNGERSARGFSTPIVIAASATATWS